MIRINLLPQKRSGRAAAAPGASQKWLLEIVGVLVVEVLLLFLFHSSMLRKRDEQQQTNQGIQADIEAIRKTVANHEEIKKSLAVLKAREDAIAKLQIGRTGVTPVLMELVNILTPERGPTVDQDWLTQRQKDNPNLGFNPGWDPRRLWLTSYVEAERVVTIEGLARDANDYSEFAKRLSVSVFFYDVTILAGKKEVDPKTKLELMKFSIQLKVRYGGA